MHARMLDMSDNFASREPSRLPVNRIRGNRRVKYPHSQKLPQGAGDISIGGRRKKEFLGTILESFSTNIGFREM